MHVIFAPCDHCRIRISVLPPSIFGTTEAEAFKLTNGFGWSTRLLKLLKSFFIETVGFGFRKPARYWDPGFWMTLAKFFNTYYAIKTGQAIDLHYFHFGDGVENLKLLSRAKAHDYAELSRIFCYCTDCSRRIPILPDPDKLFGGAPSTISRQSDGTYTLIDDGGIDSATTSVSRSGSLASILMDLHCKNLLRLSELTSLLAPYIFSILGDTDAGYMILLKRSCMDDKSKADMLKQILKDDAKRTGRNKRRRLVCSDDDE